MSANGLHRIRWSPLPRPESIGLHRKSVRERLSKYSSRYSSGCGGVLNVGKRTPSDPMESVGRDQSPSDFIESQFARDLVNIHHGIVLDVVGAKCRQTDSIGSDGVRLPRPESIGHHRKSVRGRLGKHSSRYSSGCGGVLNAGKRP